MANLIDNFGYRLRIDTRVTPKRIITETARDRGWTEADMIIIGQINHTILIIVRDDADFVVELMLLFSAHVDQVAHQDGNPRLVRESFVLQRNKNT